MNVSVNFIKTDDTTASIYSKQFLSISSTTKVQVLLNRCRKDIQKRYEVTNEQEVYKIAEEQNLLILLINFFNSLKYEFQNESFRLESYSDPEEESSDPRLAITILTKSDDIEGDIDKHHRLSEQLTELQRAESPDSNDMFLFLEYLE